MLKQVQHDESWNGRIEAAGDSVTVRTVNRPNNSEIS
jgi:hypothetical protein